jgi:hypothetical protein
MGMGVESVDAAVAVLLFGLGVLYVRRLGETVIPQAAEDGVQMVLEVVGWNCLLVGAGILGLLLGWFGVLGILSLVGAALVGAARYRGVRHVSSLRLFAAVARRGVPLSALARSMACEAGGKLGRRMAGLAIDLDLGSDLATALGRWRVLPRTAAACVRAMPRNVAGGLEAAVPSVHTQRALERLAVFAGYVLFIACTTCTVGALFVEKLAKGVMQIVFDFEVNDAVASVIDPVFMSFEVLAPWVALGGLLSPVILLAVGWTILWLLGHVPWAPPLVGRWFQWQHRAVVLRCLAAAVQVQQPLEATLSVLGEAYPNSRMQRRLRKALRALQRGNPWPQSLAKAGIVRKRQTELLQAAQAAGNLDWALREVAEASERRAGYRLELALQGLLPVVVCAAGAVALGMALVIFWPLVKIVELLS